MKKNNLRYVNFYGDGDSKRFTAVKHIYPGFICEKYECIGHVQKRMGCRLRKRRKNVKGLGGAGKLTDKMIDKLQNYYGISIRQNTGKTCGRNEEGNMGEAFFMHVPPKINHTMTIVTLVGVNMCRT